MKELGDRYYDPDDKLLTIPIGQNVHVEYLAPGVRHCTRESLYYALVLLQIGGAENESRAAGIIERVVDVQEQSDPENPLYGLWHYYAEESVLTWPIPDSNWAAFNGLTLLVIWHVAGKKLPEALRERMREAIRRAAICVRRKNTDPHYTNIALKGAFVVMAAGELLGDDSLQEYGREKMRRIASTFSGADSFAEYNSPTYAAVSLVSLGAIQTFVRDEEVKQHALVIQHSFWRHVGRHFHVPTGELTGPHSRAYHLTIRESPAKIGSLIERATQGLVKYAPTDEVHDAFGPVFTCTLDFDVAPEIGDLFLRADRTEEVREIARRFPDGGATETTSWLSASFCVGTVNFQDGWEQRNNLIAYWPDGSQIGYLRHRYLHDDRPCAGGYFTAAQKEGRILAASFLSDFADDHPCFQTEGVTTSFMGPVLEFGFVSPPSLIQMGETQMDLQDRIAFRENEILFLKLPHVWMACKLIRNRSGLYAEKCGWIQPDKTSLRIEFPHYRGESRDLKWTDFVQADTAYGLVMEEAGTDWEGWVKKWQQEMAESTEDTKSVQVKWAGLEVAFPSRAESQGAVRDFYRSGPPWDSLAPRKLLPTHAQTEPMLASK
jgi:hypothetical protein